LMLANYFVEYLGGRFSHHKGARQVSSLIDISENVFAQ